MKKYKNIIYAGTFDHLHIGHKKLLDMAFEIAEHVSLGITSDEMVKNKILSKTIEKLEVRSKKLEEYLKERKYKKRARVFVLEDIYGPSIGKFSADALLVTKDTLKNGKKVNSERQKSGFPPLELIVAPFVLADDEKPITSERIRLGEIDRYGHCYSLLVNSYLGNPTWPKLRGARKKLILPEVMREELRKPLGKVISGSVNQLNQVAQKVIQSLSQFKILPQIIISVGDIITLSLIRQKYIPHISIIDLRSRRESIQREKIYETIQLECGPASPAGRRTKVAYVKTQNKAGEINLEAGKRIKEAIHDSIFDNKKSVIEVEGEEDLLALPAILFAPLHSIILYGQWNLGVVAVEVTEEKKKEVKQLLGRFR